jgi:hypothetical protein
VSAFTDEDLKKFKAILAQRKEHPTQMDMDALGIIARLEAAERLCMMIYSFRFSDVWIDDCQPLFEAWKKSAGKS